MKKFLFLKKYGDKFKFISIQNSMIQIESLEIAYRGRNTSVFLF
jgi:hypothetical protein